MRSDSPRSGYSSYYFIANVSYFIANVSAFTQGKGERRYPRALQILGALGCLVLVVTLPPASIIIGLAVLVVGMLYRLMRLRLRPATKSPQRFAPISAIHEHSVEENATLRSWPRCFTRIGACRSASVIPNPAMEGCSNQCPVSVHRADFSVVHRVGALGTKSCLHRGDVALRIGFLTQHLHLSAIL